jgi:FF domain
VTALRLPVVLWLCIACRTREARPSRHAQTAAELRRAFVVSKCAHLLSGLMTAARPHSQVDTPWRKAMTKLEGDPAFEALDKIDRLEVFQEYIK